MKVKVVEWHAVTTWHWNLAESTTPEALDHDHGTIDELCGICRVSFDGTCPNCKYPGDECPLVLGGGCTHNFHLHCILKWLEQDSSKGLCPMCRQIFTPQANNVILSDELSDLQTLIDGHKVVRERVLNNEDQDFEAFDDAEMG